MRFLCINGSKYTFKFCALLICCCCCCFERCAFRLWNVKCKWIAFNAHFLRVELNIYAHMHGLLVNQFVWWSQIHSTINRCTCVSPWRTSPTLTLSQRIVVHTSDWPECGSEFLLATLWNAPAFMSQQHWLCMNVCIYYIHHCSILGNKFQQQNHSCAFFLLVELYFIRSLCDIDLWHVCMDCDITTDILSERETERIVVVSLCCIDK